MGVYTKSGLWYYYEPSEAFKSLFKKEKMKEKVNLTQLYKASQQEFIMATCLLSNDPDYRFECKIDMPLEYKKQLWQWVSGKWDGLMCSIEFSDVLSNGIPVDAIIKEVIGFYPI